MQTIYRINKKLTKGFTGHPKAARLFATLQAAPLLAASEPKRYARLLTNAILKLVAILE